MMGCRAFNNKHQRDWQKPRDEALQPSCKVCGMMEVTKPDGSYRSDIPQCPGCGRPLVVLCPDCGGMGGRTVPGHDNYYGPAGHRWEECQK